MDRVLFISAFVGGMRRFAKKSTKAQEPSGSSRSPMQPKPRRMSWSEDPFVVSKDKNWVTVMREVSAEEQEKDRSPLSFLQDMRGKKNNENFTGGYKKPDDEAPPEIMSSDHASASSSSLSPSSGIEDQEDTAAPPGVTTPVRKNNNDFFFLNHLEPVTFSNDFAEGSVAMYNRPNVNVDEAPNVPPHMRKIFTNRRGGENLVELQFEFKLKEKFFDEFESVKISDFHVLVCQPPFNFKKWVLQLGLSVARWLVPSGLRYDVGDYEKKMPASMSFAPYTVFPNTFIEIPEGVVCGTPEFADVFRNTDHKLPEKLTGNSFQPGQRYGFRFASSLFDLLEWGWRLKGLKLDAYALAGDEFSLGFYFPVAKHEKSKNHVQNSTGEEIEGKDDDEFLHADDGRTVHPRKVRKRIFEINLRRLPVVENKKVDEVRGDDAVIEETRPEILGAAARWKLEKEAWIKRNSPQKNTAKEQEQASELYMPLEELLGPDVAATVAPLLTEASPSHKNIRENCKAGAGPTTTPLLVRRTSSADDSLHRAHSQHSRFPEDDEIHASTVSESQEGDEFYASQPI